MKTRSRELAALTRLVRAFARAASVTLLPGLFSCADILGIGDRQSDQGVSVVARRLHHPYRIVSDPSGAHLFWTDYGTPGEVDGAVWTCSAPECADATILVSNQQTPTDIVTDAEGVYWVESGKQGAVLGCPLAGCNNSPRLYSSSAPNPICVQVDSENVYWISQQKCLGTDQFTVASQSKTGQSGKGGSLSGVYAPDRCYLMQKELFISDAGKGGIVSKIDVSGLATSATVVAKHAGCPCAFASDSEYLYWSSSLGGSLTKYGPKGIFSGMGYEVYTLLFRPEDIQLDTTSSPGELYVAQYGKGDGKDGSVVKLEPSLDVTHFSTVMPSLTDLRPTLTVAGQFVFTVTLETKKDGSVVQGTGAILRSPK